MKIYPDDVMGGALLLHPLHPTQNPSSLNYSRSVNKPLIINNYLPKWRWLSLISIISVVNNAFQAFWLVGRLVNLRHYLLAILVNNAFF
jgi:hypothetical protein